MDPTSQSQRGYTSFVVAAIPPPPPPRTPFEQDDMKWEWDDNEQWMSHASRVGSSPENLRQHVGR